jgi:hypothetical protein
MARPSLLPENYPATTGTSLKIKFTSIEDQRLLDLVAIHGNQDWTRIAALLGTRNARQCRERYKNYLNPSLRQDDWTPEEDLLLLSKFAQFGAKWNKIAKFFVHRSDNSLRNRCQQLGRHGDQECKPSFRPHAPRVNPVPSVIPPVDFPMSPVPVDLADVVQVDQKPEMSLAGIFDLSEHFRNDSGMNRDDPFDCWSGLFSSVFE